MGHNNHQSSRRSRHRTKSRPSFLQTLISAISPFKGIKDEKFRDDHRKKYRDKFHSEYRHPERLPFFGLLPKHEQVAILEQSDKYHNRIEHRRRQSRSNSKVHTKPSSRGGELSRQGRHGSRSDRQGSGSCRHGSSSTRHGSNSGRHDASRHDPGSRNHGSSSGHHNSRHGRHGSQSSGHGGDINQAASYGVFKREQASFTSDVDAYDSDNDISESGLLDPTLGADNSGRRPNNNLGLSRNLPSGRGEFTATSGPYDYRDYDPRGQNRHPSSRFAPVNENAVTHLPGSTSFPRHTDHSKQAPWFTQDGANFRTYHQPNDVYYASKEAQISSYNQSIRRPPQPMLSYDVSQLRDAYGTAYNAEAHPGNPAIAYYEDESLLDCWFDGVKLAESEGLSQAEAFYAYYGSQVGVDIETLVAGHGENGDDPNDWTSAVSSTVVNKSTANIRSESILPEDSISIVLADMHIREEQALESLRRKARGSYLD
ncbi:hypothetical protein HJFPF1_05350 [Paramyrothecium foliicola]|nr:hypothetical protein HJFPF1_05350 [Paramyrothecium foliicola]